MIYLDSAATSLWHPKEAEERMIQALRGCGNAGRGAHDATLDAGRIVFETRMRLAELFHAESPERIAFTCNDTEALNTAIFGLFGPGDHVITTVCEHNSVLRPLYALEKQGLELSVIPADVSGRIDYDQMEAAVRKNTKAFVVTHASNLTGNITDLARVCEIAERHSLRLIVDAAQTAGILPIDVQKSGIDVLCFSGHKGLLGPQGTGGIYVRPELSIRPLKMGGSGIRSYEKEQPAAMPEHLEAGTLNVHGIAGLLGALEYLEKTGIEMIYKRERELMHLFLEEIQGIPGLTLYGTDDLQQRVPTAALNIGSCDSGYVSDWLYENYGIAVRSGAHCAPLMHEAGSREVQLFPCTDGRRSPDCRAGSAGVCRRRNAAVREAAAGIRDTKEAGKRKKRYETAKRNLDSDVCGDNAGDADGAVCESARPAGKDDPRSAGNYGGLRPFLESSAGRGKRNPCGTSDGGTCL